MFIERIAQQDAERERVIEERRLALNKVAGLEATVATLKAAATSALSALAWLPEDKGPVRQRVQAVIAELRGNNSLWRR